MRYVKNIATSCVLVGALMLAAVGCHDDGGDQGPRHLVVVTRLAPTDANPSDRVMLHVNPDGGYELLHAPHAPQQGKLSSKALTELERHTTAAVAEALVAAAEKQVEACYANPESLTVDIGDGVGHSRTHGQVCLVPSSITTDARTHAQALDALITALWLRE